MKRILFFIIVSLFLNSTAGWGFTSLDKRKVGTILDLTSGSSGSSPLAPAFYIAHNGIPFSLSATQLTTEAYFLSTTGEVPRAELCYRPQGTDVYTCTTFSGFTQISDGLAVFGLKPAPAASQKKVFKARARISKRHIMPPAMEYYIRFFDGSTTNYFRTPESPQSFPVMDEICSRQDVLGTPGLQTSAFYSIKAINTSLNVLESAFNQQAIIQLCEKRPSLLPGYMSPAEDLVKSKEAVAYLDLMPDHTQFNKPLQMVLTYSDFDDDGIVDDTDIQAQDLRLFWWDGREWRLIGGKVNLQDHTVKVDLSHFSTYALFASAGNASLHPKEKIITPAIVDGINDFAQFQGLSGQVFTIKIFDITGRLIRTITDKTIWDGKNDFGQIVENGAYIYQVHTEGQVYSGAIAVAK